MDNHWLSDLSAKDRARLTPHLEETPFTQGEVLLEVGKPVESVWFPLRGVISLMTIVDEDRAVETAAIGPEGVAGVTCGPLNGVAISRAVGQTDGVACCLPAKILTKALEESDPLRAALARYTEALMAQVQQTAACNAQHRLEERLARWLLTIHDRVEGDQLELTQADIADMLGVRRATVSEVGTLLEGKGLIGKGRGVIKVLDRKGLEAASCGCYATIRKVTDALMVKP